MDAKAPYQRSKWQSPSAAQIPLPSPSANDAAGATALAALGEALRRGRQDQGLSVGEVAARLNMGLEQLQALEDGDGSRLPEAVFVIAQARRVASCLAFDISSPLQNFRASGPVQRKAAGARGLPEPVSAASPVPAQAAKLPFGPLALAAAILAGLATGGVFLRHRWLQPQAQPTAPQLTAPQPPAVATSRLELVLRSEQPSWLEVKAEAGKVLFRGTFSGERQFPVGAGLQVLAGRPDLVQAQLGTAPSRALGPIDQVRWQRFRPPAP
ncbi:MAG: helix-turn-helix domain-containing protein [Synechococcus sp.]|nr:helix-turn-helix domain-containing protein [Synechococcus sp.]